MSTSTKLVIGNSILIAAALLSQSVESLGIHPYTNICYTSQPCMLEARFVPWENENLDKKVSFEWVLPAARDWDVDECYYVRPKKSMLSPSPLVQFTNTSSTTSSDLQTPVAEPNVLDTAYLKPISTSRRYKTHLPVLRGKAKVDGGQIQNQESSLVCLVTSTGLRRAAYNDMFNAELTLSFSEGAGNVKDGRVTVKQYLPLARSVSMAGSGNLSTPGNGFKMTIDSIDGSISSLEVLTYNAVVSFGAPTEAPQSCNIVIHPKNAGAEITKTIEASITGPKNSILSFALDVSRPENSRIPHTPTPRDEYNLEMRRDLESAEKVEISCPTISSEKLYPGVPTLVTTLATCEGSDATVSSFIMMENNAIAMGMTFTSIVCVAAVVLSLF